MTLKKLISWLVVAAVSVSGYKIKRTVCDIEPSSEVMYCTCSGIGDPFAIIMNKGPTPKMGVPFYGTRYGHNFGLQIKQALVNRNRTTDFETPSLKKVVYQNCLDHPFRLKLDFEEFKGWDKDFKVDLRSVSEIEMRNLHSVNIYLYNRLEWGTLKLSFNNITNMSRFNNDDEASLIVRGTLQFCKLPCQAEENKTESTELTKEEEEEKEKVKSQCTPCSINSQLFIQANNVTEILMSQVVFGEENYGEANIQTNNVKLFRVNGGEYGGLAADIQAVQCSAYEVITNCSKVLAEGSGIEEESDVAGIVVGAAAVIIVFLIVLGAVAATRPKSM